MKQVRTILFLLLSQAALLSPKVLRAQESKPFSVTGHLSGVDARYITLIYYKNGKLTDDTTSVVDHTYTLTGSIPSGATAILKNGLPGDLLTADNMVLFYLSPEAFGITHTGTFSGATFEGSPANTEFLRMRTVGRDFYQQVESLKQQIAIARSKKDVMTEKWLRDSIESLNARKADLLYGDYVRRNTASPLQVYAFNKYYVAAGGMKDVAKMQALFDLLPDSIRAMPSSKTFQQQLANAVTFNTAVVVGKMAPVFTMNDTLDKPVSLSSFRGRYVLLDFWASWCMPCRAENPTVVKAYKKYHDKGFDVLSVSLDQPGAKAKWMKAIHDDGMTWNHVSDLQFWNNAAVKLYGIQGIPQNFLIDPQGKIVARNLRGDDLDKTLGDMLGR
jgi:peroxiredoxin